MSKSIKCAGVTAEPGEKACGVVPVTGLFGDGQPLELPFIIYNGSKEGPRVYIQIAQHPNETWGLEGVYKALRDVNPKKLSGSITFSLPNPVGFRFASYFPPHITHDINRVGYGDPKGSLMERIVDAWWVNFVKDKADYVIDIHGIPPKSTVFYEAHGVSPGVPEEVAEKSERMALLFSCDYNLKQFEPYGGGAWGGIGTTFRGACVDHGIPAIVPEISPVGAGITERGIRNILVDLGMIEGQIELPAKQYTLKWIADPSETAVVNDKPGCFIPSVKMGDIVKKGDKVGIMYSPRTFEEIETLTAHRDGYVHFRARMHTVKLVGETVMDVFEIVEVVENS